MPFPRKPGLSVNRQLLLLLTWLLLIFTLSPSLLSIGGDCPACPLPPAASRSSGGLISKCRRVIMFLCACRLPSCAPGHRPSHGSRPVKLLPDFEGNSIQN